MLALLPVFLACSLVSGPLLKMYRSSGFFFLCLILAVFACGLSLSLLPCVFFWLFVFLLTLLCFSTHLFLILLCGINKLFNATTFICFSPLHSIVNGSFSALCCLVLYFFLINICRTIWIYSSSAHYARESKRSGGPTWLWRPQLTEGDGVMVDKTHVKWSSVKKRTCGNSKMKMGNFEIGWLRSSICRSWNTKHLNAGVESAPPC